jgi:hypothetical protein
MHCCILLDFPLWIVNVPMLLNKPSHNANRCRSNRIATSILKPSTRWRRVINFMPWMLYPYVKRPQNPLDRRLGRVQSWSKYGDKNTNFCSCQESNTSCPDHSSVPTLSEMSLLCHQKWSLKLHILIISHNKEYHLTWSNTLHFYQTKTLFQTKAYIQLQ